MNRRAVRAIARKDIMSITSNIQVWLPMLIVPLVFAVLFPIGASFAIRATDTSTSSDFQELLDVLEKLPQSSLDSLKGIFDSLITDQQRIAYMMFNYFMAPFFLMIPLMAASTISVDSFVGEKERGTLEGLLLSPVDMRSIFAAKALASLIPAIAISLTSFVLFAVCANVFAWPIFGRLFFPSIAWAPLILLVMPAIGLLAVLINVFISARVSTFQAGYQMSGFLVLPVIALMIGQFTGIMLLDAKVLLAIGAALIIVDYALLMAITKRLDKAQIFESQVR
ncbi:MAG TPA: ABC transporter permease subunit [Firmicutes bacterium]|nr:ABC transporter permease subunit [Bacillota bacterium]